MAPTTSPDPSRRTPASSRHPARPTTTGRFVVALLCGVQFVDVLGVTSATTAIPAIAADLAAGPVAVTGLATAYAATFGALLVLAARAGDRWGHRRVLLVGLATFAAVAVVGALSASAAQVVTARALQGAAAAISIPSALRLLLQASPDPARRTAAIAAWSGAGAAAGAAGFVVGGALTEWASWRWLFWVNVPIGVVVAVLVARCISPPAPEREQAAAGAGTPVCPRVGLDVAGALLLATAVMAMVIGAALLEGSATRLLGAAAVGLGVLVGVVLVWQQRRAAAPLVPAEAVRSGNLRLGAGLSFANTATTSSSAVLLTLYLQDQRGLPALGAGLVLLPLSLAVVAGSAAATPLSRRMSPAHLAAWGLLLVAAGNAVLALAHPYLAGVVTGVVLVGAGLGPASVAATGIGTSVAPSLGATASGIINTAAQVGTALGVAALLAVASLAGGGAAGAVIGWVVIAVVAAAVAAHVASRHRNGPHHHGQFQHHLPEQ